MKKPFDRVITVMFENQYRSYVIQNAFLKKLASAGADMTNYFGAFHPSQTNYLASFAGEVCGVTNDDPPMNPLMQETLVDLLEAKGVSWKAYMEAYPGDPWNKDWEDPDYYKKGLAPAPIAQYPPKGDKNLSRYYRKHNAFASFHSVQKSEERWNKIVDDHTFWYDMEHNQLPEYSWFTPDIWNDGHYLYNTHIDTNPRTQLVPQQATWLEHVFFGNIATSDIEGGSETTLANFGFNLDVDLLLTDPEKAYAQSNIPKGTLIVVTFDEADFDAIGYDTSYDGPNQIYTVLLGDMIKPGTVVDTPYNHYNLIRTVEENFQLGSLHKNDHGANWFRFLWEESFAWQKKATDTEFVGGNALAITNESSGNHMVFSNATGQLFDSFQTKSGWGQPKELDIFTKNEIALTTIGNTTFLVYKQPNEELVYKTFDTVSKKWSDTKGLNFSAYGSFDVLAYNDVSAGDQKLMLCWSGSSNYIHFMLGNEDGFSGQVFQVAQLTNGAMTLGQLGASVFLVYKERNTRKMRMTSYNTAKFNSFNAVDFQGKPAPENDTSLYNWSICDFEVGHFSKKMAALGNVYQHLGDLAMATADGEMHLVHRGGYTDLPNGYTEVFGLTGIYSAESELTNGYGTLDQAGWTKEEELTQVSFKVNSPISMTSNGKTLTLVWLDSVSGTIQTLEGSYS